MSNININFWYALLFAVVGIYDLSFTIRQKIKQYKISWPFLILGLIFTVAAFVLLMIALVQTKRQ
ncbi:MAG: hypothetical protein ACFN0Y_03715 [Lactobacillus sp.]